MAIFKKVVTLLLDILKNRRGRMALTAGVIMCTKICTYAWSKFIWPPHLNGFCSSKLDIPLLSRKIFCKLTCKNLLRETHYTLTCNLCALFKKWKFIYGHYVNGGKQMHVVFSIITTVKEELRPPVPQKALIRSPQTSFIYPICYVNCLCDLLTFKVNKSHKQF